MELREYLAIVRRWWWLLLMGMFLGGGAGYVASSYQPLIYQTTTTLAVGRLTQITNPSYTEITTGQRLAQSYAAMAGLEPVLQAAIENLGLEMDWTNLRGKVNAKPILDTQLLEISVSDTDPQRVKLIADEVAQQLILQSPSTADSETKERQQFVQEQLKNLEVSIMEGEEQLQDLQAALELETTAEGIEKREAEIAALQNKLNIWQSNYALYLSFVEQGEEGVNFLTVIEPAIVPTEPTNRIELNTLLAVIVGLSLAAGVVFLLEYLDDTFKTPDDVQRVLELTTLGTIPKIRVSRRKRKQGQMVATDEAFSPVAEAYRTLRTNIQFSSLIITNPVTSMLVTSSTVSEGKSTTIANLATVMAQSGKKIILVDADLRRPTLHKLFDVPPEIGLTDLLIDKDISLETVLQKTAINNLRVLPTGHLPPNAADMLASEQMGQVIAQLVEQADMVLFDTPPLLAVTDASILATRVGGIILVIDAVRTRSEVCQRGKEILERVGVTPLGVVLNRFNPKRDAYYGGYGYNKYYSSDNGRVPHQKRQQKKEKS